MNPDIDSMLSDALADEVADVEPAPDGAERVWRRLADGSASAASSVRHRHRRGQLPSLGLAAAALLLVGLVAAATVVLRDDGENVRTEGGPTTAPAPSSTPTTVPTTVGTAAPGAVSGTLGPGFVAFSSTWISTSEGWVLGHLGGENAVVGRTVDGGGSWDRVADLPIQAMYMSGISSHLRFADDRNGWLAVGDAAFATHDGGTTWSAVSFPGTDPGAMSAIEVARGTAWALVKPDPAALGTRLYRSEVGSDEWALVEGAVNAESADVEVWSLAVHGSTVFVSATAGPDEPVVFVGTADEELQPSPAPAECPSPPVVAPWSETGLFAVCTTDAGAGSSGKVVFASTDGGKTWDRRGDAPRGGQVGAVAAASDSTLAVTAASGATFLYLSTDGGRTWTTPVQLGDGGEGLYDLGFTTPSIGVAVPGSGGLLRSTDGGQTWPTVPFP